ncbi:MAG: hypothetical protein CM1200mP20_13050 [Pseudomonadota bacterium]|nr:MAG: hypothetical protein CM1200mP20_13050 [Pseudomonadota bacterium]
MRSGLRPVLRRPLGQPINFNVGKIAGGDWASSVPAWCCVDVRAAIYPGVDPRDAAREIEACLRAKSRDDPFLSENPPEVEYNGFFARGYVLDEGSDAEKVLARGTQRVLAVTCSLLSLRATSMAEFSCFMTTARVWCTDRSRGIFSLRRTVSMPQ